jgi:DegV family protein with EDD domain
LQYNEFKTAFREICMTIRIVTDSTSDLPVPVAQDFGISVIPVYINIGNQSYLDGIDLSHAEFYDHLPGYRTPPTTAAPGIGSFLETYRQLALEGASEIISIHAAGTLSNILNVAKLASQRIESLRIAAVDSGSTSLGLGFQAIIAAKEAARGKSSAEILALLQNKVRNTYLFAALDTLEYLRRSGRASMVQAKLGSLLNIKPVIALTNGKLTLETIRTRARSIERLVAMVTELGPLDYLAVAHARAAERAEELLQKVIHLLPTGEKPMLVEATPALGTHVGPGTVGLLCIKGAQR